jgi:hypothetical protein
MWSHIVHKHNVPCVLLGHLNVCLVWEYDVIEWKCYIVWFMDLWQAYCFQCLFQAYCAWMPYLIHPNYKMLGHHTVTIL